MWDLPPAALTCYNPSKLTQAAITNPSGYQRVTFTETELGHILFYARRRRLLFDVVQPCECARVVFFPLYLREYSCAARV